METMHTHKSISNDVRVTDGFEYKWVPAHEARDWAEIGWNLDLKGWEVWEAIERRAYRTRFPDVPDEYSWPTAEQDAETIRRYEAV